jgi:hypothetical protein
MERQRLLLHAVVRAGHRLGDATLRRLEEGPVAAVWTPVAAVRVVGVREVRRHMDVVAGLFEAGPVVPFRFGTVVGEEEDLRQHLLAAGAGYAALLEDLEGAAEMILKVEPDEESVLSEVLRTQPRLRELAVAAGSRGLDGQLALGERMAEEFTGAAAAAARRVLDEVVPLARDARELPAAGAAHRVSLLVDGAARGRLESALRHLERASAGRLRLTLIGPLPPYSFVEGEWAS